MIPAHGVLVAYGEAVGNCACGWISRTRIRATDAMVDLLNHLDSHGDMYVRHDLLHCPYCQVMQS